MRITFSYAVTRPRNNNGHKQAEEFYTRQTGKTPGVEQQLHHINWDRGDGRPENLFICENQKEHDELHRQMIGFATESINAGLLSFDKKHKEYFVSDRDMAKKFKDYRWYECGVAA